MMHRNKSVDIHQFSMVPRSDIPRSAFRMEHVHKTTFDAGFLYPIYLEEMLPGDTFNCSMTGFVRLATPLFPTLDNLEAEVFYFAVPWRLVWDNFDRFMGARRPNVDSSTSYLIPQQVSQMGGYDVGGLYDHFGLPVTGQTVQGDLTFTHSALPLRAYALIWNEWFRDQNLQAVLGIEMGDGPDEYVFDGLQRRGKKHDYFTACLPFAQKGTAVTIGLTGNAPVIPSSVGAVPRFTIGDDNFRALASANGVQTSPRWDVSTNAPVNPTLAAWDEPNLMADMSAVAGATVNMLRLSFQVQKLLERDARGGTRYTEIVLAHFGVRSADARLQRPEYIGGGRSNIVINPIAQTSATSVEGSDTPKGDLSAVGTGLLRAGFQYSATEHTFVIGLVSVRAEKTYQQGMRRLWSRSTREDLYWPAFANLGEQAVLNKEIYLTGNVAQDNAAFGFQERWAEYRYHPSMVTGLMRSDVLGTLDPWHYAENFTELPLLSAEFIVDNSDVPLERATAVSPSFGTAQFLGDFFFRNFAARPMPLYSVPGLIDHF